LSYQAIAAAANKHLDLAAAEPILLAVVMRGAPCRLRPRNRR
jgi:hypothetical protein